MELLEGRCLDLTVTAYFEQARSAYYHSITVAGSVNETLTGVSCGLNPRGSFSNAKIPETHKRVSQSVSYKEPGSAARRPGQQTDIALCSCCVSSRK